MKMRRGLSNSRAGFSLIEVAVALGLVSFCLVALLGLMPMGLNAVKDSKEELGAVSAMDQIAGAIWGASVTGTAGQALGAFSCVTWTSGTAPTTSGTTFNLPLAAGGYPPSEDQGKKYGASNNKSTSFSAAILQDFASERSFQSHIVIYPPTSDGMTRGTAFITVAWPAQAVWNDTTGTWDKAQGSVSTWIYFLPAS